jgi:chromate transporter
MPGFREALRVWARIGCLSFGGPAAQIALLHREVVDQRRWVGEARFLHALNFCMLLPGPQAMQLATYLGWLMHGVRGGVVAGLLFVLPGAAVMLALSLVFAALGEVPLVAALFFGLKCAVLVLVIEALLRVARRALKGTAPWLVAVAAFLALFLLELPFPVVVLGAGLIGWLRPQAFVPVVHKGDAAEVPAALDALLAAEPARVAALTAAARRAGLVALALWLWPVALLLPMGGLQADIAWFFSKMAVVTFGGAYAVLAYVAQEAVEHYRWLTAPEMLAGLGLAEATPGPLILVLQFVGFMAGWQGRRVRWRLAGRRADAVGDVPAMLCLDLLGRPLCRAAARPPAACRRAGGGDGRGRGRDRELGPVVRATGLVRPHGRQLAGAGQPAMGRPGAQPLGGVVPVPVPPGCRANLGSRRPGRLGITPAGTVGREPVPVRTRHSRSGFADPTQRTTPG